MNKTTLLIELPFPDSKLNPNARGSWKGKFIRRMKANKIGEECAKTQVIGHDFNKDTKLSVILGVYSPDFRNRDHDNIIASLKYSLDGIFKSLGLDDSQVKDYQIKALAVMKKGLIACIIEEHTEVLHPFLLKSLNKYKDQLLINKKKVKKVKDEK